MPVVRLQIREVSARAILPAAQRSPEPRHVDADVRFCGVVYSTAKVPDKVTLVKPKVNLRNTLVNIDNIKVVGKYIWKDAT